MSGTDLMAFAEGKVPAHIQNAGLPNRNEGLITTFDKMARVSIKGKMFNFKEPEKDDMILKAGVLPQVIIAGYSPAAGTAKTFYVKGFDEDAADAPDCSSADGNKPDSWADAPVHPACGTCPNNAFGSAVKQDGSAGKGKACSDKKRLVVLPALKAENIAVAPIFVMDVPATSLKALSNFGRDLNKLSVGMETMAVELSFAEVAHPQLNFNPTGWLAADQLEAVKLRMPDVVDVLDRLTSSGGGKASEDDTAAEEGDQVVDQGEPEVFKCPRCNVVEVGAQGELCEGCAKETSEKNKDTPIEESGAAGGTAAAGSMTLYWAKKEQIFAPAEIGAAIAEGWTTESTARRTKKQMEMDKTRTERLTTETTGPGAEGAGQAEDPAGEPADEGGATLSTLMDEWGG